MALKSCAGNIYQVYIGRVLVTRVESSRDLKLCDCDYYSWSAGILIRWFYGAFN